MKPSEKSLDAQIQQAEKEALASFDRLYQLLFRAGHGSSEQASKHSEVVKHAFLAMQLLTHEAEILSKEDAKAIRLMQDWIRGWRAGGPSSTEVDFIHLPFLEVELVSE